MSITPEGAPFRPAYVRDSGGLYYRIGGGSTEAGPSVDVQPPSIPTGFATTAVSTTGFTVTWAAATDNVGVTGYEVERNGTAVATVVGTSYTATGLPASTPYTIRVRARDIAGNWSGWSLGYSVTTSAPAAYVYVSFTVNGDVFAPSIETTGTMTGTIDWVDQSNTVLATGSTPTINFGSVASRVIRMRVNGADAARVRTVNIGYRWGDDIGIDAVPQSYNWPAQPVTGISGLPNLPGLVNFLSANNTLTGFVDFTGLSQLQFIECFESHVNSINLTGCTSLIRFCFERNDWDASIPLDLNPVAANLKDVRCANGRSYNGQPPALNFATLTSDLAQVWHWCIGNQVLTNHPPLSRLPAVVEYWAWGNVNAGAGPSGQFQIVSPVSRDIRGQYTTGWTTYDDAGRHPTGQALSNGNLSFDHAGLTSVLLHSYSPYRWIYLQGNPGITTSNVDQILNIVNGWNTSGSPTNLLDLRGCGRPSTASSAAVAALRSRGWTVDTEPVLPGALPPPVASFTIDDNTPDATVATGVRSTSTNAETWEWNFGSGATPATATTEGPHNVSWPSPGVRTITLRVTNTSGSQISGPVNQTVTVGTAPVTVPDIWVDTFDVEALNVAAMGNGWNTANSPEQANTIGGNLVRTNAGSYSRIMTPTTVVGGLPNNLGIEVIAPAATWGAGAQNVYSGIAVRYRNSTQSGIRAFFYTSTTELVIGNAEYFHVDNRTLTPVNGLPAGWSSAGDHSLRLEVRGLRVDVFADQQHVGYTVLTGATWANDGLLNPEVGMVGDGGGGRQYRSIRVYPVTGTTP